VREQRVVTPDGRVWYVRRRWARRRPPWRRRPDGELSPEERGAAAVPDGDDLIGALAGLGSFDAEAGPLLLLGLLALAAIGVLALVGAVLRWVVPFVTANAELIGLVLAAAALLVLVDLATRPWYIEAESGRVFSPPRRVWRVHGWWRSRRAFRAVVAAAAEGRIDGEHAVVLFPDRSQAPR
jgi:hypothetical protein